jgi:murein DD-endopeptidase MepM/ murein hydrolase activator NlpD
MSESEDSSKKGMEMSRREFLKRTSVFPVAARVLKFGDKPENHQESQEQGLEKELQEALEIIHTNNVETAVKSRYLVAALYYSEAFFAGIKNDRQDNSETAAHHILSRIKKAITPEFRAAFIKELEIKVSQRLETQDKNKQVKPVAEINLDGWQYNHPDAVDLFIKEGSEVVAMARGMVILAEGGWTKDNPYSTTSYKGGNCVIIYNPESRQFYRYCHLSKISVKVGDVVTAGKELGFIGHTGLNASKNPESERHLHLEINQYDGASDKMNVMPAKNIIEVFKEMDK